MMGLRWDGWMMEGRPRLELDGDTLYARARLAVTDLALFAASVPAAVRASVTTLDLDYCDVDPVSLVELATLFPNVERLWSFKSGLQRFPVEVCALHQLKTLSMPCNPFAEIPSEITRLTQLEHLYIYRCRALKKLPSSFSRLTTLEELQLEGCLMLPETMRDDFYSSNEVLPVILRISVVDCLFANPV
jgi:hypothetical protein